MAEGSRKKIGILFNFNGSWLGGVYYVQNIIKALNHLEDVDKPEIIIFYKSELKQFTENIDYPYYSAVQWKFPSIFKGYIKSWILRKNFFIHEITKQYDLKGIYPLYNHPITNKATSKTQLVAWFPDLQHKFFPGYFNKLNLLLREIRMKMILRNSDKLVVSSLDVKSHFDAFYEVPKKLSIHVLPFVSIIDGLVFNNYRELKHKYNLPDNFFMISNQFYEHKNHIVVIKALKILKERNINAHIVMTGKMEDYRNPEYIKELKRNITSDISKMITFLGVIPRQDQLCIMKHSAAVIQPSLFEGWSTVIEDAKSLNVPVISSDIAIHKEQLTNNGIFFKSSEASSLAKAIESFKSKPLIDTNYEKYEDRVLDFAENFVTIFK